MYQNVLYPNHSLLQKIYLMISPDTGCLINFSFSYLRLIIFCRLRKYRKTIPFFTNSLSTYFFSALLRAYNQVHKKNSPDI